MAQAWFPFFVGDYLADTQGLSFLEHGVYLRLLMMQWSTKQAIPLIRRPEQQTLSKCLDFATILLSTRYPFAVANEKEAEAIEFILEKYFTETESGYVNNRMMREIAKYQATSQERAVAGSAGGNAKKNNAKKLKASADGDSSDIVANAKQLLSKRVPNQNQNQNHIFKKNKQKKEDVVVVFSDFEKEWISDVSEWLTEELPQLEGKGKERLLHAVLRHQVEGIDHAHHPEVSEFQVRIDCLQAAVETLQAKLKTSTVSSIGGYLRKAFESQWEQWLPPERSED